MKVIDKINGNQSLRFSYEIVPPARGRSVKDIIEVVEQLQPTEPAWIDVTSHASTAVYSETEGGEIQRKTTRKRPGTIGICGIIQNRFKIDTVAHILCQGFSREETEDALIELHFLGIHNVLALRGDHTNYKKTLSKDKTVNEFAADLVEQLSDLRQGRFIEEISNTSPLDFGVGVAGYPEKHFESPNLKSDLLHLKQKVEAGADYIITQMFFENEKFFSFVKECRALGIQVPIIPGLKILKSAGQLKSIPRTFHIDMPEALVDAIEARPNFAEQIGQEWAIKQVAGLIHAGFKNIHFYVLNDCESVIQVVRHFQRS